MNRSKMTIKRFAEREIPTQLSVNLGCLASLLLWN